MMTEPRVSKAVEALRSVEIGGDLRDPDLPYAEVLRRADELLGSFASLPAPLRAHLLELYDEEEAIRTLARGALSQTLLQAGALLGRALYRGERWVANLEMRLSGAWAARAEVARQFLRRTARQSTHLPFALRGWLHRAAAKLRLRLGHADLATLLCASNFDTRALGYEYLEGLRQIRGCEAVLKRGPVTYTQLVGLDFIQSDGRYWFLEANFNPSLMDARLALYEPGEDPWVHRLMECALRRGLRRLVVYGYRPFSPAHAEALTDGGRRNGVEVHVIDDSFSNRNAGHHRAWLMQNGAMPGALVVRAKGFDVLFDRALLSKQQTRQILEQERAVWQASVVELPRLLTPESPATPYRPDSRYPNLVGKIDGVDRGAGVSFFKLPRVPAAPGGRASYFEEYRVPDPCRNRISRGQSLPLEGGDERAWKIRSYALLTPEGVEYLSSIKVISGRPVPAVLPEGRVEEKSIFLATINEGGVYSAFTAAEDAECSRAVQAVGEALLAWLKRKYAGDSVDGEARQ